MLVNDFTFTISSKDGFLEVKTTPNLEPLGIVTVLTEALSLVPEDIQEYVVCAALEASKVSKKRYGNQVH